MHIPHGTKLILSLLLLAVLSFNSIFLALAQAPSPTPITTLTPTPTPLPGQPIPGDTTILIIGAFILVLIILGGVFKQSRLRK